MYIDFRLLCANASDHWFAKGESRQSRSSHVFISRLETVPKMEYMCSNHLFQVIFALVLEFIIFHTVPPFLSFLGISIILFSAYFVAVGIPRVYPLIYRRKQHLKPQYSIPNLSRYRGHPRLFRHLTWIDHHSEASITVTIPSLVLLVLQNIGGRGVTVI
jgi:hypothetical protein